MLDDIYKIHERSDDELFIEKRFTFYQHPVDPESRLCQPRKSMYASAGMHKQGTDSCSAHVVEMWW